MHHFSEAKSWWVCSISLAKMKIFNFQLWLYDARKTDINVQSDVILFYTRLALQPRNGQNQLEVAPHKKCPGSLKNKHLFLCSRLCKQLYLVLLFFSHNITNLLAMNFRVMPELLTVLIYLKVLPDEPSYQSTEKRSYLDSHLCETYTPLMGNQIYT